MVILERRFFDEFWIQTKVNLIWVKCQNHTCNAKNYANRLLEVDGNPKEVVVPHKDEDWAQSIDWVDDCERNKIMTKKYGIQVEKERHISCQKYVKMDLDCLLKVDALAPGCDQTDD